MAYKERDVWQTPRNAGVGVFADALATGKRGLNYIDLIKLLSPPVPAYANRGNIQYDQPRDAKLGLGDVLLGNAPEEVDRWSYGDSPFYEQHYGFNPTLRPDRRANILDTALLPVGEAVGAAKLMGRGATKAAEKAGITSLLKDSAPAVKATDGGRRAVLKGLAAVPAAAAAAHVAPKLFEKTAAKDAEKIAGKAAKAATQVKLTPHEYHAARAEAEHLADIHAASVADNVEDYLNVSSDKLNELLADKSRFPNHYASNEELLDTHIPISEDDYAEALFKQGYAPEKNTWISGKYPHVETVEDIVEKKGKYVDPFSGNTAKLNSNGELVWSNGHGDEKRYQHWLNESKHKLDAIKKHGPPPKKLKKSMVRDTDQPDIDYDVPEFKRGGTIENTTHDRKMI
jgi:hypothetical protein